MSTVLYISLTAWIYCNVLFNNGVVTLEQLLLSALNVDAHLLLKAQSCDVIIVPPWDVKFEATRETILIFFTLEKSSPILHIPTSYNYSTNQPTNFTSRYHKLCSIAFHSNILEKSSRLETVLWAASFPGGIFGSFHVFTVPKSSLALQQKYWYFRHVVQLSKEGDYLPESIIGRNHRLNWNLEKLMYVSWEGSNMVNAYLKTRRWAEPGSPTMYFFALYINATLAHNSQETAPQRGEANNGQWDSYLTPLLGMRPDHISTIRDPSSVPYRLVYTSRPVHYDSVLFYTPLPVELPLNVAAALTYPFTSSVWVTVCGVAVLLIVLQAVHRSFWISHGSINTTSLFVNVVDAALATVKVLLEQPARVAKLNNFAVQIIISWCIVTMVLCTLYRSQFFGAFVKPEVLPAPKTFSDLLATYRFHIHSIALDDDLDVLLNVINDKYTKQLLNRTQSEGFAPLDAVTCCRYVANGSGVCLGYASHLQFFVFSALHSLQGEALFEVSKEFYSYPRAFVISCLYPNILESLNGFIQRLQPQGFYEVWTIRPDISLTKLWYRNMKGFDVANILQKSKAQAATWPLYASFLSLASFGSLLGVITFLAECRC